MLTEYKRAFERYGGAPALSFADEPGSDPERRMASNYLNRLTRQAGMRTWVTYYPHCEQALAGHRLAFDDTYGGTPRITPEWLTRDEHARGYWDFSYGTKDRTDHGNDGELAGNAHVADGALVLPDQNAYMRVPDSDWLDLPRAATTALWMRVDQCPSDYARHPLSKWGGIQDANLALYLLGELGGV